jgi:hypothetical protein
MYPGMWVISSKCQNLYNQVFCFVSQVPWPVDVVISSKCQNLYNQVFCFVSQVPWPVDVMISSKCQNLYNQVFCLFPRCHGLWMWWSAVNARTCITKCSSSCCKSRGPSMAWISCDLQVCQREALRAHVRIVRYKNTQINKMWSPHACQTSVNEALTVFCLRNTSQRL